MHPTSNPGFRRLRRYFFLLTSDIAYIRHFMLERWVVWNYYKKRGRKRQKWKKRLTSEWYKVTIIWYYNAHFTNKTQVQNTGYLPFHVNITIEHFYYYQDITRPVLDSRSERLIRSRKRPMQRDSQMTKRHILCPGTWQRHNCNHEHPKVYKDIAQTATLPKSLLVVFFFLCQLII